MKTAFTKLNPGDIFNHRYRLEKPLGNGSCGEIWEVLDMNTNQIKAMKCLTKQDSHRLKLFTQEAAALMRLKHSGIPRVIWGEYFDEPLPCFVMEKIEGINLETWLLSENNLKKSHQKLTLDVAVQWLKQMVEILIYLHDEEYIHRDIKPANIILGADQKLRLIDFGLVKKIPPSEYELEEDELEIKGMGTPGYIAPEQNDGNSQPKSDIYALGYTFKRLLTNKYPTELKANPKIWRNWLNKCPFWNFDQASLLVKLLDQMTDEDINNRPTAREILQQCLIIEKAYIQLWKKLITALIIAIGVTVGLIGVREKGWLELWELKSYDLMMQQRPDGGMDERLLIIGINDEDDKKYKIPISDNLLAQAIEKLQLHKPSVIGLNLLRDRPEKDGYEKFISTLKTYPNIITSCYHGSINPDKAGTPSPPGMTSDKIGFLDVFTDALNDADTANDILRRQILFRKLDNSVCDSQLSSSFQTSIKYLFNNHNISPQILSESEKIVKFGSAIFQPLTNKSGGYRSISDGDFQILLDYRSRKVAEIKSLNDVLENRINPQLIKDKIIIIGNTEEISKNSSNTPLGNMPAVEIEAQMVSQIISNALGEIPVLSVWKPELEIICILGCSLLGCIVILFPYKLILSGFNFVIVILIIYRFSLFMFIQGYWIPLIPSLLSFIFTFATVVFYNINYQWINVHLVNNFRLFKSTLNTNQVLQKLLIFNHINQ